MAMTDIDREEAMLDRMLAGLAQDDPIPSDVLMRRVLADAAAVQASMPVQRPLVVTTDQRKASVRWGWLSDLFGHGSAKAGLGTAAIAGVLLGFLQPAPVASLAAAVWGTETAGSVDLLPGIDDFMAEG